MTTQVSTAATAESAPATEVEQIETQVTDATADSSPAGDQDAPPPSAEDKALAEIDARIAKATGAETEAKPSEATSEADAPKQDEPEAGDKPEAKPDALSQESKTDAVADDSLKPFAERAEWQALTKIGDKLGKEAGAEVRKTLRAVFERETRLTQSLEQAKPAVEMYQEMYSLAGNNVQGVQGTMNLIRQFEHDPKAALVILEKLADDARARAGLKISSPDILTKVQQIEKDAADGLITAEQAEERKKELSELESLRFSQKRAATQSEQQKREQQQTKAQAEEAKLFQSLVDAENQWEAAKSKSDPDFKLVEPLYGKFAQLATANFQREKNRWPTVAEGKQILDKAYADAKAEALKFKPVRKSKEVVRDDGSSRNTRHQPMTDEERFMANFDRAVKNHS